ncbi:FAD-binding oxidoreductase [Actinomycetospora cinnamomea]|uniref:Delta(24)-sterol reductase n=1 Tax=Actinomycetospora cinnamomea TaxID=663609 RepID=A0A2U1EU15_9PSEU|nr:FAD-binding oxidoreductase [Actinomycetospora cinnamomea]PVZ03424.1 FAD/FMN-containing dehydrogenase [Actinomycetospora cinnamomea]
MTVGADAGLAHRQAVDAVRRGLAELPPDAPVRLRKRTSNLFRFRDGTGGLSVEGLDRVLAVDADARTADVAGMTTYSDLVAATLPHGLMPLVVPQLKTITLGGAVVGLGIESTSFRDGLPHESVLEADVLTGTGDILSTRDHPDLLSGLPNSYGTLGYALRLRIELAPVKPFVRLRHLRFDTAEETAKALAEVTATREWAGERVDFCDGVVFSADEHYVTLGEMVDTAPYLSDYTGQRIYYRSIQELAEVSGVGVDFLTIHDYLWRWDTDWFWCSRALGVQHPVVRRLWPSRYRRSDVYRRLVALDRRLGLSQALARRGGAAGVEPIIQDVEVPVDRLPEFLAFFHDEIGISPVWLCPLRQRDRRSWPLYPLDPDTTYVNVGFWSDAELAPGQAPDHHNRRIEQVLLTMDGHKSLYSTASYPREEFDALYGGEAYRELKARYDPDGRLPDLYTKTVTG